MSEAPNVFLSWSGARSKAMASALNEWLPDVIQSVVPFFSDEIETGAFWDDSIKTSLKEVRFAVICCTPENITAPWLNYEAGALAERMEGATAPWLLDSKPEALKVSPLSRLMARTTDRAGTFALLQTLNTSLERGSLSIASLTKAFERLWEDLEKKLKAIPEPMTKVPERSDRDMLEEVVGLCRELARESQAGRAEALQEAAYRDAYALGLGPQGAQGWAQRDEMLRTAADSVTWGSVRQNLSSVAQNHAKVVFGRELSPAELEEILSAVRKKTKAIRGHRLEALVAAEVDANLQRRAKGPST